MNHLAGGRLFPGEHHRARFSVQESADRIDLDMHSDDGAVSVRVRGRFGGALPGSSCFASLPEASSFFELGSLGYSVTRETGRLDGIELRTHGWRVEPLQADDVQPATSPMRRDSRRAAWSSTARSSCATWGMNREARKICMCEADATDPLQPSAAMRPYEACGSSRTSAHSSRSSALLRSDGRCGGARATRLLCVPRTAGA